MTTMISEVYDAFRSAGADETHARKAAEAISQADSRFSAMDLKSSGVVGDITLLKWMMGVNSAFLLAVASKLFIY